MSLARETILKGLTDALAFVRGEPVKGVTVTMTIERPFKVNGIRFAAGRYEIRCLDAIPMPAPAKAP